MLQWQWLWRLLQNVLCLGFLHHEDDLQHDLQQENQLCTLNEQVWSSQYWMLWLAGGNQTRLSAISDNWPVLVHPLCEPKVPGNVGKLPTMYIHHCPQPDFLTLPDTMFCESSCVYLLLYTAMCASPACLPVTPYNVQVVIYSCKHMTCNLQSGLRAYVHRILFW